MHCKAISTADTYLVRHPVLRPGKAIQTCAYAGDELPSTAHFGLFDHDTLVAVLSVFAASTPLLSAKNQVQFRGMAVLETHQNKGIGALLMDFVENQITLESGGIIWLNARLKAVPFYEKMGYQKTGEAFCIGDIGLHFIMYKIKI